MNKNKLYIFIAILTSIFLFGTAAILDQCKLPIELITEEIVSEPEEVVEEKEEAVPSTIEEAEELVEGEVKETEEEVAEREEEAEAVGKEEKKAPTIKLQIYEGPKYSAADNVCYYRIEAKVTGNPTPDVDFSKDDSGEAWGQYKCQVNIHGPNETYTLTATATNSQGTATDSTDISWGCEEGSDEPSGEGGGDGDEDEEGLDFELPEWVGGEIMGSRIYYDFTENAPSAIWKSDMWHYNPAPGLGLRTFGDMYTRYGAAFHRYHGILEDGSGQPRVLETHPYMGGNGFICGIYQNITVPENAKFRTKIGFLEGHVPSSNIYFQVFFDDTEDSFGDYCDWYRIMSFHKDYSGVLYSFTAPLDRFAGRTGNFVFIVKWGNNSEDCYAIWVNSVISN